MDRPTVSSRTACRPAPCQVLAAVLRFFPPSADAAPTFVNRAELAAAAARTELPAGLESRFKLTIPQAIKYVYATGIGPGAKELATTASLAHADGTPLELASAKRTGDHSATRGRALVAAAALAAALVLAARIGMRSRS